MIRGKYRPFGRIFVLYTYVCTLLYSKAGVICRLYLHLLTFAFFCLRL